MAKQWKRSLSGADVQDEAEDALEKDIANLSPASNSVAGNLDGGIAAVDWASKTTKYSVTKANARPENVTDGPITDYINISGSGYLLRVAATANVTNSSHYLRVVKDGTEKFHRAMQTPLSGDARQINNGFENKFDDILMRFDSSLDIQIDNQTTSGEDYLVVATYVLD